LLATSNLDLDSRRPQKLDAFAVCVRRRVYSRDNNLLHLGTDYGFRAWPRLALVTAGLERDIHGRPLRLYSYVLAVLQRNDLGMSLAELLVPSFTHYLIVFDYQTTDSRIRLNSSQTLGGVLQSHPHIPLILTAHYAFPLKQFVFNILSLLA
jgi:hypothetical protein